MTPLESLIEVLARFDALFNDGQVDAVRNMERLQKALSDAQKVIDATEDEDEVPCPDCNPDEPGFPTCLACVYGGEGVSLKTCKNLCPLCPTCHGTRFVKREVPA